MPGFRNAGKCLKSSSNERPRKYTVWGVRTARWLFFEDAIRLKSNLRGFFSKTSFNPSEFKQRERMVSGTIFMTASVCSISSLSRCRNDRVTPHSCSDFRQFGLFWITLQRRAQESAKILSPRTCLGSRTATFSSFESFSSISINDFDLEASRLVLLRVARFLRLRWGLLSITLTSAPDSCVGWESSHNLRITCVKTPSFSIFDLTGRLWCLADIDVTRSNPLMHFPKRCPAGAISIVVGRT
mmetsp:Transcript_7879/g.12243  ORF Transcript_7879/g.12243 Transcript_7879/m.12243 type:complete len:242 (+) Transcript_7879:4316-5041(+)